MSTPRTITGRTAILVAARLGIALRKYADATSPARDDLTAQEALAVVREDPSLIYVDSDEVATAVSDDQIERLARAATANGDGDQALLCDAALDGSVPARVECVRALTGGWAQEGAS